MVENGQQKQATNLPPISSLVGDVVGRFVENLFQRSASSNTDASQSAFDTRQQTVPITQSVDTTVLTNDPARIAVYFASGSAATVYLGPKAMTAERQGIPVTANDNLDFYWSKDGALTTGEWHAYSDNPGSSVTIVSVSYRPKR